MAKEDQNRPAGQIEDLDIDLLYAWGDASQIRKNQARYLPYFQQAPGVILDLGCGRGIMLDLFKQAGLNGYGLDLRRRRFNSARTKGSMRFRGTRSAIFVLSGMNPSEGFFARMSLSICSRMRRWR